ncbi:MAG: hypothetical protein K2X48_04100 [Chitinophagaceae bacterium]|nr:hypothetical protein [Chitinophagaceae bacterium]
MRYTIAAIFLLFATVLRAQVTDTSAVDEMDYSKFGDAEGVKRYVTQKVLNQTPNKIISIGYEYQGGFNMPEVPFYPTFLMPQTFKVNRLSGLRAQVNIPVVSNTKLIWQLGANYWRSGLNFEGATANPFISKLESNGMHTAGINTTIFKPFNEKNFLILQASADVNGVFEGFDDVNSKAVTISATAIYGWKKSEKNMIGVGVARTYRAGQLIYVPIVLWNKTFNDQWGMELLLPARGHLRRNFSTSNILQIGYELEGNQYWMRTPSPNGQVFIQRGELKPRVMWDKKLKGFFWLNVQAGFRYNWRFDVMNEYDARKDSQLFFRSALTNPFYFSVGLNFVSP